MPLTGLISFSHNGFIVDDEESKCFNALDRAYFIFTKLHMIIIARRIPFQCP